MIKIEKIINSFGANLYDILTVKENDNLIYRILITHKDGVSLELCSEITKAISPIIDLEPPLSGKYFLEVSSPGIERKLKKIEHFSSSIGELVSILTNEKEKLKGTLVKVEDEIITLENETTSHKVEYKDISKAKTYYQW